MPVPPLRRLGAGLAVVGGTLVLAPSAFAGEVARAGGLTFTAAPGEANTLTVTYEGGGQNRVLFDDGATDLTSTGLCATVADADGGDNVACGNGVPVGPITVDLGDGNDTVTYDGFDLAGAPDDERTTLLGAGTDTVIGDVGPGLDRVSYAGETAALTVDLSKATTQTVATGNSDTLVGIEHLTGGSGADKLAGSSAANEIAGGDGNDLIDGAGGDDVLDGEAGNDAVGGGDGDDTVNGTAGNDALAGGAGNDTLDGAADNDFLQGGLGNDTVTGGAGSDAVSFADAERTTGVTVTLNGAAQTISAGETETDATVEAIVGSAKADTLTDTATTSPVTNVVDGGGGDDTIVAEPVTTTLGMTTNVGDTYTGGLGKDTVAYTGRTQALTLSLDDTANDGVSGENDAIDVEDVTGGSGADTITGKRRRQPPRRRRRRRRVQRP